MTDSEKILDKIKKCLALSASANEHEASIALRQAQKLMAMYGITDIDVKAAQAQEAKVKSGATQRPAGWESNLANIVASAFGCQLLFHHSWQGGHWGFVGCGAAPEVAQYAFEVLLWQVKRARADHIQTKLSRCKTVTKTRRADLFCDGWVRAVSSAVSALAGDTKTDESVEAFMATRYPELVPLQTQERNKDKTLTRQEIADYWAGAALGKYVQLHQGMGHQQGQHGMLALRELA